MFFLRVYRKISKIMKGCWVFVEQSLEATKLIDAAGMISETSFVLETPEETRESIRGTSELIRYCDPDFVHFLMLAPWLYHDVLLRKRVNAP